MLVREMSRKPAAKLASNGEATSSVNWDWTRLFWEVTPTKPSEDLRQLFVPDATWLTLLGKAQNDKRFNLALF